MEKNLHSVIALLCHHYILKQSNDAVMYQSYRLTEKYFLYRPKTLIKKKNYGFVKEHL